MFYGLNKFLKKVLPKRLFYRSLIIVAAPIIILQFISRINTGTVDKLERVRWFTWKQKNSNVSDFFRFYSKNPYKKFSPAAGNPKG